VLPNIDSLDQRVANTKIELATLFYTSIERPDSAMYWYKRFVAEYPSNPGVPRSLYTMGQIIGQDSTKSAGSADSLYREIIQRFPSSEFASESRKILGLPPDTQSIDPAQLEYTRAQNLVLSGNFADAVSGFRRVVDQYPKSLLASRAQYAIGWIYENQLIAPDSAIANYKILISTYPTSPFVSLVQAKLTEVQLERSGARKDTVKATKDVKLDQPVPPKKAEETVGKGRRARQQEVPDKLPEKE
jgi:TolA-binding protein